MFGFNGQEKDDEIAGVTGAHYEFKFREYDSRIGRFWSVDPLTQKYPYWTPYAFAGNTPIWAVDLEGLEPAYKNVPASSTIHRVQSEQEIKYWCNQSKYINVKQEPVKEGVLMPYVREHFADPPMFPQAGTAASVYPETILLGGPAIKTSSKAFNLLYEATIGSMSATEKGVTLLLPKTMEKELPIYKLAAEEGKLMQTTTKGLKSNARKTWEKEFGEVPENFDVDHIIQRQHGGTDDISNLQLKESSLNKSEGSKAYHLNKQNPAGTKYSNVKLKEE